MEYFEDCEHVNLRKASLRLAEVLGRTLEMIHEAGVVHGDIAERNVLLVREGSIVRVVWIDFSCAWSGPQYLPTTALEWAKFRGFVNHIVASNFHISDCRIAESYPVSCWTRNFL